MGCNLFFEQTASAIGQMGCNADVYSHAVGELSKVMRGYSHVEDSSLSRSPVRPSTIVKMSIVRKPVLKIDEIKSATLTIDSEKINWDVLEKNFGPFDKGDVIFYK